MAARNPPQPPGTVPPHGHRRTPQLLRRGPHACEIGGRWNDASLRLVVQLVRSCALRAPAPLRGAAWYRRWWGLLSVAVQNTLAATLLGSPPVHAPMPGAQAPPPCRTSCTTHARPRPAACRPAEPLQSLCSAVARRCTGTARGSPEKPVGKKKPRRRATRVRPRRHCTHRRLQQQCRDGALRTDNW